MSNSNADGAIESMVSDLVQELDYDIWKSLFVEDCIEDPECAEETRAALVKIVKKHLLHINQAPQEP